MKAEKVRAWMGLSVYFEQNHLVSIAEQRKHANQERAAYKELEELEGFVTRLAELEADIPRDTDGRPILGIKMKDDGGVHLSNWAEPWIAEVAELCRRASGATS